MLVSPYYYFGLETRLVPNGLELSRPASTRIVPRNVWAAVGRVGSVELLGGWQETALDGVKRPTRRQPSAGRPQPRRT